MSSSSFGSQWRRPPSCGGMGWCILRGQRLVRICCWPRLLKSWPNYCLMLSWRPSGHQMQSDEESCPFFCLLFCTKFRISLFLVQAGICVSHKSVFLSETNMELARSSFGRKLSFATVFWWFTSSCFQFEVKLKCASRSKVSLTCSIILSLFL